MAKTAFDYLQKKSSDEKTNEKTSGEEKKSAAPQPPQKKSSTRKKNSAPLAKPIEKLKLPPAEPCSVPVKRRNLFDLPDSQAVNQPCGGRRFWVDPLGLARCERCERPPNEAVVRQRCVVVDLPDGTRQWVTSVLSRDVPEPVACPVCGSLTFFRPGGIENSSGDFFCVVCFPQHAAADRLVIVTLPDGRHDFANYETEVERVRRQRARRKNRQEEKRA